VQIQEDENQFIIRLCKPGVLKLSVPGPLYKSRDIRGPLMRPDLPIQIVVCIAISTEFKLLVSEVVFVSHICSYKITTLLLDRRCHYTHNVTQQPQN